MSENRIPYTSASHPILIGELPIATGGIIGVTFCPGKKDPAGIHAHWDRDLDIDLAAIRDWGASFLVTLIEDHEFDLLQVRALGEKAQALGLQWLHLPIRDVDVPNEAFELSWQSHGRTLRAALRGGGRIVVHCRGGLGRAGTIAARLLVEFGEDPDRAINLVRTIRSRRAIETVRQEAYIRKIVRLAEEE